MIFEKIIDICYNILWSPALVIFLVLAGLYFSIRTRFLQVRHIRKMYHLLFYKSNNNDSSKSFTSFQAFCVALSGRVGTGNIVGVATAIALGGPGAVFWMWVIAFLGSATAYMESTLAHMYRYRQHNSWRGGPYCYIEKGIGMKWLGILFALFIVLGYGMLLLLIQSNSFSAAFNNSFSISPLYSGIVMVILLAIIIIGGLTRIAHSASIITSVMACGYIILALIVLAYNWKNIPSAFATIFSSAFGFNSAFGGLFGSAVAMGVKRGLYSNEAGQGGGAIVSASANVEKPAHQGLVQAFSVYIDTLLVCTATALMIICTRNYNVIDQTTGEMIFAQVPELGSNYLAFTQAAVNSVFPGYGSIFVTFALALFTFSTTMAFYYYAESAILYICSKSKHCTHRIESICIWIYRFVYLFFVLVGACMQIDMAWKIGDIGLGLTVWINVIALIILCPKAIKALKDIEK